MAFTLCIDLQMASFGYVNHKHVRYGVVLLKMQHIQQTGSHVFNGFPI